MSKGYVYRYINNDEGRGTSLIKQFMALGAVGWRCIHIEKTWALMEKEITTKETKSRVLGKKK